MDQRTPFNETASVVSQASQGGYNPNINLPPVGRYSSSAFPHYQGFVNRNYTRHNEDAKQFDTLSISATDDMMRNNNEQMNLAIIESDIEEPDFDNDFLNPEDFESMVGDLRRSFVGWLKKTEATIREQRDNLSIKMKEFKEYKAKTMKQIKIEKQFEMDKLKEERRKTDAEVASSMKQIQIERDDTLKKLNESKIKFENERDIQKRRLAIEKQKFQQELEIFKKDRARIYDNNIVTQSMVEINVGGVVFETSRHNLTQQQGSFLAEVFSGRTQVTRDKQGMIFFDRDSETFRIILNFLRNPDSPPVPRDAEESVALARDAEFYRIKYFPYPLVYACGGHSGVENLRAVEVFDLDAQQWRPCKSMMTERSFMGGATLHSFLYTFGGQNLDYKALCDVEVYDCLRDIWMNGPSLNVSRRNNAGITFNDRIFTIGGFDGQDVLSSVEALDPRMKNWMELAPMNTPRSAAMVGINDNCIYVMGGAKGNRLRSVEIYDPRVNRWQDSTSNLIEVRSSGASATLHSNFIFAMGGNGSSHTVLDSCETLNKDKIWSFVKSMPEPRMDFSATAFSDSIMISGGQNIEVLQSTEFFRPDENEWKSGPPMLFPRYGHSLLVASI